MGSHSAVKRIPLTEDWTATIQSHLREALTTKKETKTNKQKKKKKELQGNRDNVERGKRKTILIIITTSRGRREDG